jgi:HAE1 family hydrophobic/amphiphilic exporter-1
MGKSEKIECAIPSAGQRDVVAAMEQLADEVLPDGFGTEWTGVTYQQQRAGNLAPIG